MTHKGSESMNLISSSDKWYNFHPENLLQPEFKFGEAVSITLPKEEYSLGKWICDVNIIANKTYKLKVKATTSLTPLDVWVVFSTHKSDGSMQLREHAEKVTEKDGSIFFEATVETDKDTASLKLELWIKGSNASVDFSDISLTEHPPLTERRVSICTTYIDPYLSKPTTLEVNLQNILTALDNTAKHQPDIVLLSEGMYHRAVREVDRAEFSEDENGDVCKKIAQKASELNSYVIYNFSEKVNNYYYNTSLLFNRKGEIVGKYRKTHLTMSELEDGIVAGNELPIFETDFGKIGMITCWDQYFTEAAKILSQKGAEIIFIPTAGEGGCKSFARAMDNGVYVVVSGVNGPVNGEDTNGWLPSRIISPLGNVLAQTGTHLASAHNVIDLNKKEKGFWLSVGPAQTTPKGCYQFEGNRLIK